MIVVQSNWLNASQKKIDRYLHLINNKTYNRSLLLLHSTKSSKFRLMVYKMLLMLAAAAKSTEFTVNCWSGRGRYLKKLSCIGIHRRKILQKPYSKIYLKANNVK